MKTERFDAPRRLLASPWTAGLVVALLLTACAQPTQGLQEWMAAERARTKPSSKPLDPPRKFEPQPYLGKAAADPYGHAKLLAGGKHEDRQLSPLILAEMNRRKEPLESYSLDSLVMVGSVFKQGKKVGLLRAESGLQQVKVGNYVGENFGRVTKITETEITLREVVQDAVGEWIEREAKLQLQEGVAPEKTR